MTHRTSLQSLICLSVLAACVFLAFPMADAASEENKDAIVHKVLSDRTKNTCKSILPAWFASKTGVQDPQVRVLVTDCYMGHARLAILGVKTDFSLAETSLSEVPAVLLQKNVDIDLDIYRPLAGRTLRVQAKKKQAHVQ
jgi:hypothetical protein